jgi:hypothetical protein
MICSVVQKKIIEDLDHRFEEEIGIHLGNCSECRHLCEDLVALEELAQSLGDQYKAPTGFGARVVAQANKIKAGRFFRFRPVLVPLAIVMLSFGFFWMNDVAINSGSLETQGTAVTDIAVDIQDYENGEGLSYVEVVIEDEDEGEMILRLPSIIEVRRTEWHEDFYYQNIGY